VQAGCRPVWSNTGVQKFSKNLGAMYVLGVSLTVYLNSISLSIFILDTEVFCARYDLEVVSVM
jgi:hypothetical protein